MKTPICCFGEVLIDFLQDPTEPGLFRRFAGGAPANVAVAVAKLGGHSFFAGMVGQDMFGDFLCAQLQQYGVDCGAVTRTSLAKTALAFVALDSDGDRSFSFYRPPAADLLYVPTDFPTSIWHRHGSGIFHVCSNSLTEPDIAATTLALVAQARQQGWLISVDANLRHNLWPQGAADRALVLTLLQQADLVKLSDDELTYLAEDTEPASWLATWLASQWQQQRPCWVLVTAGAGTVQSHSPAGYQQFPVQPVAVVDTTAAGDSFVGAWLWQIAEALQQGKRWPDILQDSSLQLLFIAGACRAGALTCQQFGAFQALPDFQQWQSNHLSSQDRNSA